MELKKYQQQVIADLTRYLNLLQETNNIITAYNKFWNEKSIPVGMGGVPPYQNVIPNVPDLCLKVPTGGGKTFLACNAIAPIFDAMPFLKMKAVVWLVPSEAILTQTLAALRNTDHPYRQKIDMYFGSRVEVYSKDQLLMGQNFNVTTLSEQLSIMVLSYDSFRGRKEQLKAKQENSALAPTANAFGTPDSPIEDANRTSLLQIINQLNPLVIVDESHHARSSLSKKMLQDFNPCFVLDLTATPTKESNIISYVDSVQLKRENMVKLPVVVYNRQRQNDVILDAIDLRNNLEQKALDSRRTDGYIRPIVLFQAQTRGKEDSTTFERLRKKLADIGVPDNQIAIKTADVNELKGVDLMSESCPIRYIITVNALKEGWDCPFAYILASLANRTSKIDVEQIVGRILRQPHTRQHTVKALNMSYVLTSSNDFGATLSSIVEGLNGAGFSRRDCRVAAETEMPTTPPPTPVQPDFSDTLARQDDTDTTASSAGAGDNEIFHTDTPEFMDFDPAVIRDALQKQGDDISKSTQDMLDKAEQQQDAFSAAMQDSDNDGLSDLPQEVRKLVDSFAIVDEFKDEVEALRLPQFFVKVPGGLFSNGMTEYLRKETLLAEFSLHDQPSKINFETADDEIAEVDVLDGGGVPKVTSMDSAAQQYFREQFSKRSSDERIRVCKDLIHHQLNKMDSVDSGELRQYIDRVVSGMNRKTLDGLEKSPNAYAQKIKKYIEALQAEHQEKVFYDWLEIGKIVVEDSYAFPRYITALKSTDRFTKSLYTAEEDDMDGPEADMVLKLTGLPNIKWWHRNHQSNNTSKGFCLNGARNHFPDFIVMTTSGKIVIIETKGDHLDNKASRQKLLLGRKWMEKAGENYRYYMVFQKNTLNMDGSYTYDSFMKILPEL